MPPLRTLLLPLLAPAIGVAQSFGGLPGTLGWSAIAGDSVTLITTAPGADFARRALALDESLVELRPLSLGERIEPVDVVVQPLTVVPNGFVGLAPFRSYLYATAPQQQTLVSTNPWVDALAIHEYRHVEQYANLRRGWTRLASVLAGDAGWGTLIGLGTPDWFLEGDAVYAETALTYAGRGRTPEFTALQRALALDSVRYAYPVARNGSLRRRVPNHYPLGYALVAHGRHAYEDPWPEVVRAAGTFWPPFYPFSVALERTTGKHTPAFYREAYDSLGAAWRAGVDTLTGTPHRRLTPLGRDIPRYATPAVDDGELYAQLRSQNAINRLVALAPDGRPARVVTAVGANVDDAVSLGGGRAAWSQLRRDPRRPNEEYSVIVVADLQSGTKRVLTERSHLFSPGISPDGLRVAAVEQRVGLPAKLVVLAAQSGAQIAAATTELDLLAYPRFTADGEQIVAVAKREGALALVAFPAADPTAPPRRLSPWTRHTIGIPAVDDQHVVFSASFTGIDNVFRVPLDGRAAADPTAVEQLTGHPVGAYQPAVAGDSLYFTTVAVDGDPVEVLAREEWLLRPLGELREPYELPAYASLDLDAPARAFRDYFYDADPEPSAAVARPTPDSATARPYSSLARGFSVHTWQPLADQTEASITIVGSNVLNDLRAELEAGYNLNETAGFGTLDVTLARTWPHLTLRGGLAGRDAFSLDLSRPADSIGVFSEFQESSAGLALEAPLQQTLGAYTLSFRPEAGLDYLWLTADEERLPGLSSLTALDLNTRFSVLRSQAAKQILPRLGLTFDLAYRRAVDGSDASQLQVSASAFLPGLARSHGIRIRGHARVEDVTVAYQFQDFYPYARGYDKPINSSAVGATAEYHFPLLYPDVGLWGIAYARRLRAAAWADVTRARLPEQFAERDEALRSIGVDLTLDAIFFNVQALPVGVRFAYRLDDPRFGRQGRGWAEPQLLLRLPL